MWLPASALEATRTTRQRTSRRFTGIWDWSFHECGQNGLVAWLSPKRWRPIGFASPPRGGFAFFGYWAVILQMHAPRSTTISARAEARGTILVPGCAAMALA